MFIRKVDFIIIIIIHETEMTKGLIDSLKK